MPGTPYNLSERTLELLATQGEFETDKAVLAPRKGGLKGKAKWAQELQQDWYQSCKRLAAMWTGYGALQAVKEDKNYFKTFTWAGPPRGPIYNAMQDAKHLVNAGWEPGLPLFGGGPADPWEAVPAL